MAALPSDILHKLSDDVKSATILACAKVAIIHCVSNPENDYQRGYSDAASKIAAMIRKLGASK